MKFEILVSLLLSSTAFAGPGRWRRQDAPSSAASAVPSPSASFTICRDDSNCGPDQRCQYVTRNPDGSGFSGACVAKDYVYVPPPQPTPLGPCITPYDCRVDERCEYQNPDAGGIGTDGQCVPLNPSATTSAASSSPSPVSDDCRISGCPDDSFCSLYSFSGFSNHVCFLSAIFPPTDDCRSGGCPGGECGYNSHEFQCFFDNSTSSSSASSSSTAPTSSVASASASASESASQSPLSSSVAPTVSATSASEPSQASASAASPNTSAAPSPSPSPSPAPAPAPAPAPESESSAAPVFAPNPAPSPSPSSSAAPAPAPAPASDAESDSNSGADDCVNDVDGLYQLLEEILQEIKCIQADVKELKGEL